MIFHVVSADHDVENVDARGFWVTSTTVVVKKLSPEVQNSTVLLKIKRDEFDDTW